MVVNVMVTIIIKVMSIAGINRENINSKGKHHLFRKIMNFNLQK